MNIKRRQNAAAFFDSFIRRRIILFSLGVVINMNQDILDIDKEISGIFRTKENQEKFAELLEKKQNLLSRQSSYEVERLNREIDEIKQRKANSGAKRYQLLQTINERMDEVKIIEPQIEAAKRKLNQANLELSFFEQSVSEDRKNLKILTKKLDGLTGAKDEKPIS